MRIVNTQSLTQGMILGKPVFTSNGSLLLNKDIKLTNAFIRSLKQKRIPAVYIDDEISEGIELENALDLETKIKAVETVKSLFENMNKKKKGGKSNGHISPRSYKTVRDTIDMILENIKKNDNSLFNMIEVMSTDLSSYIHCVNVAVLAILTGRGLGFSKKELIELGTGALMHDIGKSQVPLDIINKSEALTGDQLEEMKKHTTYGYNMVKDNPSISAFVKTIILMHHERLDGSGYPLGVPSDKINDYVKIVSICDIFHTSIFDSRFREKMPIYKALELLESQIGSKIDERIYGKFVKNISIFPQGVGVLLNTGERGIVTEVNSRYPTRPKIRIIRQRDGKFCPGYKNVDLMKELTIFIEDTCDVDY